RVQGGLSEMNFKLKGTEVPNNIIDLPTEVAGSLGQQQVSLAFEENICYNECKEGEESNAEQIDLVD
ncbi:MAG: hypothetical protein ACYTBW_06540, partial [Planctomycetota bacterium]